MDFGRFVDLKTGQIDELGGGGSSISLIIMLGVSIQKRP